jgi:hypothetical protein
MRNISRRVQDYDPFGFTLQVSPSLLNDGEDNSRLYNVFDSSITQFDVGRISCLEDGNGLPDDDKFSILSLNCAVELTMGRIIPEHVGHVVEVKEAIEELKAILITRHLKKPNPSSLTFTRR